MVTSSDLNDEKAVPVIAREVAEDSVIVKTEKRIRGGEGGKAEARRMTTRRR